MSKSQMKPIFEDLGDIFLNRIIVIIKIEMSRYAYSRNLIFMKLEITLQFNGM